MKKIILFLTVTLCLFTAVSCSEEENNDNRSHLNEILSEANDNTAGNEKADDMEASVITDFPNPSDTDTITEAPEITDVPVITEEPEATKVPAVTEEPEVTDVPVITEEPEVTEVPVVTEEPEVTEVPAVTEEPEVTDVPVITEEPEIPVNTEPVIIPWDESWEYAEYSLIHDDSVRLYSPDTENRIGFTVAVNAGHGTKGGSSVKTLCHPDGTPKVTGGSTAEGSLKAAAVSSGTTTLDGIPEAEINLRLAMILKDKLLEAGCNVLMIRENDDTRLDNIARTVYANNNADCHVALHFDSSENDKGLFYIGPADVSSYRSMEPVAGHWQLHEALGNSIIASVNENGIKLFGSGYMPMDLTQISYSTIASVDLEVGDRASDFSDSALEHLADAIAAGILEYALQSE